MSTNNAINSANTAPFTIAQGGTGSTSFTAYAPILGGTAYSSASNTGFTNGVYTDQGSSFAPIWTNPGFTKISSSTAANQATLDFTGLSSTYIAYYFVINTLAPVTNATSLLMRISHNGSSWISTSSYGWELALQSNVGAQTTTGSSSDTSIRIIAGVTSGEGTSGLVRIFGQGAANEQYFVSEACRNASGNPFFYYGASAIFDAASAIQGVRFLFSSGNISRGTITLYGVLA